MNYGFIAAQTVLRTRLVQTLQAHPKRLIAAVAALLLSGAGGAFAVAALGPDVPDQPVSLVTESVASLASGSRLATLGDGPGFTLYRSEALRSTDTPESLLRRLGVADPAAAAFLRRDSDVQKQLMGRNGRQVTVETTEDHRLLRLTARWTGDEERQFKRLVVEKAGAEFKSRVETAALQTGTQLAGGVIQSSLFAATDEANIPDAIAVQMAELFSGEIDFRRGLRKGDRFAVVYETLEADGEVLKTGRVLSAEFRNGDKTHQAVWFQEPGRSEGAYYALDGQSLRRAYLSAPLAFTRVSSGFGNRFHPIHQRTMAHQGTDYAAPTGTAVRTVGEGVVEFAGTQNGYGNVVIVKHRNQHTTLYAHLSRIDVRKGQSLSQGQTVGAVGATGWATGPHLHFEFRINGQHQDPMQIAKQSDAAAPVSAAARAAFQRLAAGVRLQFDASATLQQASAE